jgi:lipopolysaccharide transport system permease protein
MVSNIRELFSVHELILAWAARSVRVRYQQSLLGGLWAVLQPLASVAIFTVIFTLFVPVDTGGIPYPLFSYVAMVPWTFFASSIHDMVDSLVFNISLVTKIYFPREILPIAALLARMVDFGISACVFVLFMLFYRWPVNLTALLYLPLILAVQLALSLGIGFAGAALNVF